MPIDTQQEVPGRGIQTVKGEVCKASFVGSTPTRASNTPAKTISFLDPLKQLWQHWKRIAKKIGDFQSRVLLVVFYFVIFCPFALAIRWGSDPLSLKKKRPSRWLRIRESQLSPLDTARNQF